jgi:hypothetical protein
MTWLITLFLLLGGNVDSLDQGNADGEATIMVADGGGGYPGPPK